MRAMVLDRQKSPLKLKEVPKPKPGKDQLLVRVHACGVCRTDLHVVDGDLTNPHLPLIPGHQIVGTVVETGIDARTPIGKRVGIPWLGGSCGQCRYCLENKENLCEQAIYTGYQVNGGFADYCVANEQFCFELPENYPDLQVAPLLCAGLIGFRALRLAGNGKRLGFYGFGSSAHLMTQVAHYQGREVYAFTRPKDTETQSFALSLGAVWSGDSDCKPPVELDAAIIFASSGELIPKALQAVSKGGTVVCAGIHMSDIPSFPYRLLWEERILRSVANLTRQDGVEFLALAPKIPIKSHINPYPLEKANEALDDLRHGRFQGSAVIVIS
jgi:alcohol dehydrogenase, propanol-preferring